MDILENSIYINGKYYELKNFGVPGRFLSMLATTIHEKDMNKQKGWAEIMFAVSATAMTQDTILSALDSFMDAMSDEKEQFGIIEESAKAVTQSTTTLYIPLNHHLNMIFEQAEKLINGTPTGLKYEPKDFGENPLEKASATGFWSDKTGQGLLEVLGNKPVTRAAARAFGAEFVPEKSLLGADRYKYAPTITGRALDFLGLNNSEPNADEVDKAMYTYLIRSPHWEGRTLKFNLFHNKQEPSTVDLTKAEAQEINARLYHKTGALREEVSTLIARPEWKNHTAKTQEALLQAALDKSIKQIHAEVYLENKTKFDNRAIQALAEDIILSTRSGLLKGDEDILQLPFLSSFKDKIFDKAGVKRVTDEFLKTKRSTSDVATLLNRLKTIADFEQNHYTKEGK
jgi:hypothetical protein